MSIFAIAIGFLSAYYAGKLSVMRDMNKIERKPTPLTNYLLEGLLVLISLYYMVALLGM